VQNAARRVHELAVALDIVSVVEWSRAMHAELGSLKLLEHSFFTEDPKSAGAVQYMDGVPGEHNEGYLLLAKRPIESRETIFGAMKSDTDNAVQIAKIDGKVFVNVHAPGAENPKAPSIQQIAGIVKRVQEENPEAPVFVMGDLNQEPDFVRPRMEQMCAEGRDLHAMPSSYLTSAVNGPWQGNPSYATSPRPAEFIQIWAFIPKGPEFKFEQSLALLSRAEQATIEVCGLAKEKQEKLARRS